LGTFKKENVRKKHVCECSFINFFKTFANVYGIITMEYTELIQPTITLFFCKIIRELL